MVVPRPKVAVAGHHILFLAGEFVRRLPAKVEGFGRMQKDWEHIL